MQEKRPLVWLSAAPHNLTHHPVLESQWRVYSLDLGKPPSTSIKPPSAKVGILDLREAGEDQQLYIDEWLGALELPNWVATLSGVPTAANNNFLSEIVSKYCSDYHTDPVDPQRLSTVIGHLWGMTELQETCQKSTQRGYQSVAFEGNSRAIKYARLLMRKFAGTSEPVLIQGEGGTGKEAAARFIHQNSARRQHPMVTVNCAALPVSLTQSELFSYEKGAFTHALKAHVGRLEMANGGTLLFAGIDELKQEQQSAILRFLQEGQIERVGGTTPKTVDARIIATSTRSLEAMVDAHEFRSDVFYRISGLQVTLPPLRERPEDLPELCKKILSDFPPSDSRRTFNKKTLLDMATYSWPGNLRELQNRLRQAVLLTDGRQVKPEDLGLPGSVELANGNNGLTLEQSRARAEQHALSCSLALTNHNVSAAARMLKISRVSFYRLMEKHDPTSLSK
ncbi:sigma-54-dependent transcriptional regulator [Marinobacter changyiensis]|uniref:sigma-54-dependent transcriptional regulator n=1 Tax=Marinobacter changyiensis TaxID=2604091 RepID=UPI001264EBDB|nr:sigma-54 dependent transcriptional regulator [Marinobacter changyiensis]